MSKAFTKESDEAPVERPAASLASQLPPGTRNYLTPEGARMLQVELDGLLHSHHDAARDRRIRELRESLALAEVVDPSRQDPSRILFGATVTVSDAEGREHVYRIVGIDEADARSGRISWLSPLAKALLGRRVGDAVTVRTPRGTDEVTVEGIVYETAGR